MKLYYLTGACSLASNIALHEAGLRFELAKVDRRTKKTSDGLDFNEVNPKGYVPALRLDDGEVLTENVAVLQYIADRNPASRLAPAAGTMERYRLMELLSFINSELHKNFSPLFHDVSEDTKQYSRKIIAKRLEYLQHVLGDNTYLMGEQFTVADAYLYTVLSWAPRANVDLGQWPNIKRYVERVGKRGQVVEALRSEGQVK
jgi:glutathione S-transferase